MTDRVHVNYYDESNPNDCSMYTYPIKNACKKKKSKLTLWVGYDIGGKNYITGEIEQGVIISILHTFLRKILPVENFYYLR